MTVYPKYKVSSLEGKWKQFVADKKAKAAIVETYVPPKKRVCTNVITRMMHFHDFYYLQAMQADLTMRLASNEELQFSKAVEKLQDNIEKTCDYIFPNLALRTFMYLYAACLGEARHANDSLAEYRFIENTVQNKRETIFNHIAEYPPTDTNIQAIVNVFDQDWRSGYGGEAWLDIAKALKTYKTLPPSTFLDHVIDLEHNNGTVFSKPDGKDCIFFDIKYPRRFSTFLEYKFEKNILKQSYDDLLDLSPRVYRLLEKYCTVFQEKMPNWVTGNLENLDDYSVEWGNEELVCKEKWCKWIGVQFGNVPNVSTLWDMSGFEEVYIPKMKFAELQKHIESCKRKAKKYAGKFMNKELKKELEEKINEFMKQSKLHCRPEGVDVVYPILPVKVKAEGSLLKFQVPAKYFGIGTEKSYGFFFAEVHPGFYLVNGKEFGFDGEGGYSDCYLVREYGTTRIYIDNTAYTLGETKLEVLLD